MYTRAYNKLVMEMPLQYKVGDVNFGSARLRRKNQEQQLDVEAELITEYLWHAGRIRYTVPKNGDETTIRRMVEDLTSAIKALLNACAGGIFLMEN